MPKQKIQSNPQRERRQDSEFDQKLLDVARVVRVTAGGRRFSFRAVVAIGDHKGRVGVGVRKGKDVRLAMEKASKDAKKHLINVPMTNEGTLPHESYGKSSSAVVFLKPAPQGRGIIAGGAIRVICDLAGYKSIVGKMISRTNNKLNNARAAIKAFEAIKYKGDVKSAPKQKENADSSNKKSKTKK